MTTFDYNYQNSFRFCFVIEICQSRWGLKNNSPNLHKKTTNWRILVVVVKWRHRAIVLFVCKCRLVNSHNWTDERRVKQFRVFSLTWPAYMLIYCNKRKRLHSRLHKKRVQLPEDWFATPTWPPFHFLGHQCGRRDVMWKHSNSQDKVVLYTLLLKKVRSCCKGQLGAFPRACRKKKTALKRRFWGSFRGAADAD